MINKKEATHMWRKTIQDLGYEIEACSSELLQSVKESLPLTAPLMDFYLHHMGRDIEIKILGNPIYFIISGEKTPIFKPEQCISERRLSGG